MPSRLGIDIGGTSTDFLLLDSATGRAHALKTPNAPDDLPGTVQRGVRDIAQAAGIQPGEIDTVIHGTQPQPGGRVGLLVSTGFEHVLAMGRGKGSADGLANLPASQIRGIAGRVSAQGDVAVPLDDEQAHHAIAGLIGQGIDVLAVCLMNAHANPDHEVAVAALAQDIDDRIPVVLSNEVAPEADEFERTLATVATAALGGDMRRRIAGLQAGLQAAEISPRIEIAQSTGAHASRRHAADAPAQAVAAGPAGAANAAAHLAGLAGHPDALVLDLGGSTAALSLVRGGMARLCAQTPLGSEDMPLPAVDVRHSGAGGGSVAYCPGEGVLRVGPKGARPACLGGQTATVMDANVVLARLPGETLGLDVEAAQQAMGKLAQSLGVDRHRAAEGVVEIFEEQLAGALRRMAVEKGEDPARFALVAGGGAGPLYGASIAGMCGAETVIIPRAAGAMSALGFALSERTTQFVRWIGRGVGTLSADHFVDALQALQDQGNAWLAAEGVAGSVSFRADMRYRGGRFQMSSGVPGDAIDDPAASIAALAGKLSEAHKRRFGMIPDAPAEITALRAIATAHASAPALAPVTPGAGNARNALTGQTQVYFGGFRTTSVYDRAQLGPGQTIAGPALVMQDDATTVLPPGTSADVDAYLNLIVRSDASGQSGRA